ncbi:hypothetical protein [Blastococcus litoris]|uniref:hypothetical protein n=1 Tax=Blastococcus litoris TaxID=2171622 RepID=UPI000E306685|nr:hypothetical protein [Blastococcus litoris]
MLPGRLRVVGLLVVMTGALAGCTGFAEAGSEAQPADVAVPSYEQADGAPGFCDSLAGSRHLTAVAPAMGVLAAERGNVEAELELATAIDELRDVLEQVEDEGGSARLEAAIGDLVDALAAARDDGVTTAVRDDVAAALDDVGRLVQPVCRFPT